MIEVITLFIISALIWYFIETLYKKFTGSAKKLHSFDQYRE